jgi:hypothetical protein
MRPEAVKHMLVSNLKQINKISKCFNREQRSAAVQHEGAKLMLNLFDMADEAGLTEGELLCLRLPTRRSRTVSEHVHRLVERSVYGNKKK